MDKLKGARIPVCLVLVPLRSHYLQLPAKHRLTIESATQRAIEAERIGIIHETTLKDKIEEIRVLQETVDLTRQCSNLTKELVVTLQKLDEQQRMYVSHYVMNRRVHSKSPQKISIPQ
jgi:hypothetical protein